MSNFWSAVSLVHVVSLTVFVLCFQALMSYMLMPTSAFLEYWWVGVTVTTILAPMAAVASAVYLRRLYGMNAKLADELAFDSLTGLVARGHFMGLDKNYMDTKGVLLMIDIDHFKTVNDTHGHEVGDRVLCGVSAALKKACRSDDVVCRYGGEEFVVFCPNANLEFGTKISERLCATVRKECKVLLGDKMISITVSGGWGVKPAGMSLVEYLRYADAALYAAKAQGRDMMVQVCSANLDMSPMSKSDARQHLHEIVS